MTSSTPSVCHFQQLPDLVLEPLFEFMAPHDLLHLSMTSPTTFELIQYMRAKATISFIFAPNKTKIQVKTTRNAQSFFIIGNVEGRGKKFTCSFGREQISRCRKLKNGVVYPHGLDTVLTRILRLYPRAVIGNIKIDLSGATSDEDYEPLFEVLEIIKSKEVNADNVRFETGNAQYSASTFQPMLKIFKMFGSKVKLPESWKIEDGNDFPCSDYLEMGLRSVVVDESRMNDTHFNEIIRTWNAASNTNLCTIIIRTSEHPFDVNGDQQLLLGLSRFAEPRDLFVVKTEQCPVINSVRRPTDQKVASIVRAQNRFVFRA